MKEYRNTERFFIEVEAKVTFRHRDESPIIETVSGNISNNGALLKTSHNFPLASKVQVDFFLDLESLKQLKFVLPVKSLKELAKHKQLWVSTSAVVLRQESDELAVVFEENYTINPVG